MYNILGLRNSKKEFLYPEQMNFDEKIAHVSMGVGRRTVRTTKFEEMSFVKLLVPNEKPIEINRELKGQLLYYIQNDKLIREEIVGKQSPDESWKLLGLVLMLIFFVVCPLLFVLFLYRFRATD